MYKALRGRPMTVRFLDPPLHEFLPKTEPEIKALAKDMGFTVEHVKARIAELHEFNPMMGLRGCRLGVIYPEITRMQTRAVIEAAIAVKLECNYDIVPEIMVPLVGDRKELLFVKHIIVETAEKVMREKGYFLNYKVGTMIEIPRAALTADEIAKEADFFSFGTNDLTQMTFGFSRDDAGKFLETYYDDKIYEFDPFSKLGTGPQREPHAALRHLRRTRRRSVLRGLLPGTGPGLRFLLAVPCAYRPSGCGTGSHQPEAAGKMRYGISEEDLRALFFFFRKK